MGAIAMNNKKEKINLKAIKDEDIKELEPFVDIKVGTIQLNGFETLCLIEEGKDRELVLVKYRGSDEDVIIPDGIGEIAPFAFKNNTTLKSIVIPDSVTVIGQQNFLESLQVINYVGTEEQWHSINIDKENEGIKNAKISFNCTQQ